MALKIQTKKKSSLKIKTGTAKLDTVDSLHDAIQEHVVPMSVLGAKIKTAKADLAKLNKSYKVHNDAVVEQADIFLEDTEKDSVTVGDVTLTISAKKENATIADKDAVILALEAVEEGLALQVATFGITALRQYFTPEEFEANTTTEYGGRTIKV